MRIAVSDAAATRGLRRAVLRPAWPADSPMHGDENPDAVHFAAVDGPGDVVGACLALPRPYPHRPDEPYAWQLRGMAAADGHRGHGIGAQVLAFATDHVAARGARLLWCEARTSAVTFYELHGYAVEGAEYLHAESGIPHRYMWRALSAADPIDEGVRR